MLLTTSSEKSRRDYAEKKERILNLLNGLKDYYRREEDRQKLEAFEKLSDDLENGEFSIVVVGEFSAGKSTLLNALMGYRILPSFSNETTATVNFLRHSDKAKNGEMGRVFYTNGEEKQLENINIETVMEYVSTKGDDVVNNVKHLDLYLDSPFLKDGVTLVDSPGLNGIADGHREITENQILQSHASIFLFNSDHPGSKTDFEFLHELQQKVKTIIFVLNKIDEIRLDEGETPETVIETLKRAYKKKFPKETSVPEIWPVSAFQALVARSEEPMKYQGRINRTKEEREHLESSSRLREFEDRLLRFLTCGEKARQQLLAPVEKVIVSGEETIKAYMEEISVLRNSTDSKEITKQIELVKESIEGLEKQIASSKGDVENKIRAEIKDMRERLIEEMIKLQNKELDRIADYDDPEDLQVYRNNFEKSYIRKIKRIAIELDEQFREKLISVIKMLCLPYTENVEGKLLDMDFKANMSVSEHLDPDERVLEVGLREMDEKINRLKKNLEEAELRAEQCKQDYYLAKKEEQKREKLEREIKELEEKKDAVESEILPPIERYIQNVIKTQKREGVFGRVANVLIGQKKITIQEQIDDRSRYDDAVRNRHQRVEHILKKIEFKENELKNVKKVESEEINRIRMEREAEKERVISEIEQNIHENKEKIQRNYDKELKRIKHELTDYCDSITDELTVQVRRQLSKTRKGYVELVMSSVVGSAKEKLVAKKNQLERLEKELETSIDERNKRIDELEEKRKEMGELIKQANELKVELLSREVDIIKREDL